MTVIDAHAHLGTCTVFDVTITEEELLGAMNQNGIDVALVQPLPGAPDAITAHDAIAALAKKYPGRIIGVVSANPRFLGKDRYFAEVERCIKELGFVGVKLHTIGHAVNPISEVGGWVFEAAHQFGVPITVHTGTGIPFAMASACIPRAMQYPHLPIVINHAGFALMSTDAYVAAKVCPNVYLETSWSLGAEVKWWVNELGAHRVMMGADLPNNKAVEVAKYRALDLTEEQYHQVLGGTAIEVFRLPVLG
ncbi:MAG: amidohydrolase [Chloroflexi bacterium]|nr:amidohydrolase [Chloroflexota bacterium]